jgi:phospholipid-binding lipoprotein MlaA
LRLAVTVFALALSAQQAFATPSGLATPLAELPVEQAIGTLSRADVTEAPVAAFNAEAPIVPARESLATDVAESMPIMTAQADDPARIPADTVPAAPVVVPAADARQAPSAQSDVSRDSEDTPDLRDPFESINRQIFAVNMALDEALVLPVARAYERHVPQPVQTGLRNMMSNLLDPYIAANSLLQGKPLDAVSDLARFAVNTTVGVLGIADPATELGLQKHREDFGQTLGVWGVPPGPYVMLPLFGPSTVRDTVGFVVDVFGALLARFKNTQVRYSLASLEFLQQRVRALPAQQFLDEAFDPYLLIRNGYLQRRSSLIYDGDPPTDD